MALRGAEGARALATLIILGGACTFRPASISVGDGAGAPADGATSDGAEPGDAAALDAADAGAIAFLDVWPGAASGPSAMTTDAVPHQAGLVYVLDVVTKPAASIEQVVGMGAIWAPIQEQCSGRSQQGLHVWIGVGAGQTDRVQVDAAPGTASVAVAVSRFANVTGVPATGTLSASNTAGGACTGGVDSDAYSMTISLDGTSHLHQAVALRGTDLDAAGDFTERVEVIAGQPGDLAGLTVLDRPAAGATALSAAGTFSSATDWAVALIELQR